MADAIPESVPPDSDSVAGGGEALPSTPDLGLSLHEAPPRSPLVALAAELEGVVAESERGREALRAERSRRQQRSARNADRGQRSPTLAQQVATVVEMRYEAEALLGGRSPQRRDSDSGSGSGSESEGSESEGDGRGDDGGAPDVEALADSIMDNPEAFGLIGSKMPQRDDPQFRRLITSMLASALAGAGPPPPPPPEAAAAGAPSGPSRRSTTHRRSESPSGSRSGYDAWIGAASQAGGKADDGAQRRHRVVPVPGTPRGAAPQARTNSRSSNPEDMAERPSRRSSSGGGGGGRNSSSSSSRRGSRE